ncbi:MAG TPA: AMP-binding protein, partial [Thermomicrobiales bacterium]|nr:AMP-binding protein [Thermomicrobiales bacterium]
ARLGLDPARLRYEDIQRVPVTPKGALRDDPDAFVRRAARPALHTATTGTTGRPTSVHFSAGELRTMVALSALGLGLAGDVGPEDIVQLNTSSRATLGNLGLAGGAARLGALVAPVGLVAPARALALLAAERRVAGKQPRVSVLSTYPSYLGELVECGLRLGYRPADFGLARIFVGGELVTAGLLRRARRLFGELRFVQNYAMTELLPMGGARCDEGHLHFAVPHGLLEVVDPETCAPARPGEPGTIVATPFPPFRDTTILLRYDTEDVVRPVAGPLACTLRHLPATTDLLGKLRLAVRNEHGWTFPRDVAEALEAVEAVPLPARYGYRAEAGGVAVEAVVRAGLATPAVRREIEERLAERGVPVRRLRLVEDPRQLRRPLPLRCDLRETSFGPPPADDGRVSAAGDLRAVAR